MNVDKIYKGEIVNGEIVNGEYHVTVDGNFFDLRLNIRNHSPDGFCWGYKGSGPAQLALAILIDFFGDELKNAQYAVSLYQEFKRDIISKFNRDKSWVLNG